MAQEHATQPSEADRYLRGMELLLHTVQEISLARDLPAIQRIVRAGARALTGADGATFVLRDKDQCHYADEDAIAPLWKGMRFPLDACVSGWSMIHKQAAVIPDIYQDSRIPADAYRPTFVKSLAMVPIRRLDPIGAIGNYWAQHHMPTAQEVALLQALADSTAVAIENVRVHSELEQRVRERTSQLERANVLIHKQALTDELTGLHNRRGFLLVAEQGIRLAIRERRDACLMFIDVDGLKPVNDQFGHEAGDDLLRDVGDAIRETFRDSDVVGRIGGDEFCVLAIDMRADAQMMRQRLQEKLKQISQGQRHARTVSIGIVPVGNEGLDELLTRADHTMYLEKRAKKAASVA